MAIAPLTLKLKAEEIDQLGKLAAQNGVCRHKYISGIVRSQLAALTSAGESGDRITKDPQLKTPD